MSTVSAAFIVVAVGAATYAMRAGLILVLADRRLPMRFERALRNVAPAVLAALVVNLVAGGSSAPDIELAEAAAVGVAIVVAYWRRHLLLALAAGMATLWFLVAIT